MGMNLNVQRLGFFRRLPVQLGSLIFITAVLPMLFLGFFSVKLMKEELLKHAREVNRAHAEQVSFRIDEFFVKFVSELRVLAESLPVRGGNWRDVSEKMEQFLVTRKSISKIAITDKNGDEKVILSSTRLFFKNSFHNVSDSEAFKETRTGNVFLGEIFFEQETGQAIKISVPVKNRLLKRVEGMIFADISLRNLLREAGTSRRQNSGSAFMVDQNGVVIAHKDFNLVLERRDASHLIEVKEFLRGEFESDSPVYKPYTALTGEKVFGAHAHIFAKLWGVIVEEPYSDVLAPLKKLILRVALFLAGAVLLTCTIIYMMILYLIRPVTQLTEAATKLGKGEMAVKIPVYRTDELGYLIRTFNQMSRSLEESMDALRLKSVELERSEKRYRNIFESVAAAIWDEDFSELKRALDGLKASGVTDINRYLDENPDFLTRATTMIKVKDVNVAAVKLYKTENKEELLQNLDRTFTPDSFQVFRKEIVAIFEGQSFFESETITKNPQTGTPVNTLMTISFPEPESTFDSVLVCMMDITARKKAQQERTRLKNYLENIINSMPSIIIGVDVDGVVTQWNREADAETGVSGSQARGQKLEDVFPRFAGEMVKVQQAILSQEVKKDTKVLVEDGVEARYNDITVYPLNTDDVQGAVIRIDDVTDSVRIEEMMIQSEKMLSVGGLAAGMAHEINNPLAGILQSVQVLKNRLSPSLPKNTEVALDCDITIDALNLYLEKRGLFRMISSIMESGIRAEKIVRNILSFSRKGGAHAVPSDLSRLLDTTVDIASSEYDLKKRYDFKAIKIMREYEQGMPEVSCDPVKIQQVFLNILKNGAFAMAENPSRPSCFILRVYENNGFACVDIEDNGSGMEEHTRKRVFEPFYTTKEEGAGTGLGMSVSYFIVSENHDGNLFVESSAGKGSRFVVELPLCTTDKELG